MKLSRYQRLWLKAASLTLRTIILQIWLTTVYEFHGPLEIWRAYFDRIDEEKPPLNKETLSKLKYYIYTDFSDIKPNPEKHILTIHLYTICSMLRIEKLTKLFPLDLRIPNKERTGKYEYRVERANYRFSHHIAKLGHDLKPQYYEEYKYIANKYNWPIIYNSTDEELL